MAHLDWNCRIRGFGKKGNRGMSSTTCFTSFDCVQGFFLGGGRCTSLPCFLLEHLFPSPGTHTMVKFPYLYFTAISNLTIKQKPNELCATADYDHITKELSPMNNSVLKVILIKYTVKHCHNYSKYVYSEVNTMVLLYIVHRVNYYSIHIIVYRLGHVYKVSE